MGYTRVFTGNVSPHYCPCYQAGDKILLYYLPDYVFHVARICKDTASEALLVAHKPGISKPQLDTWFVFASNSCLSESYIYEIYRKPTPSLIKKS